MGNCCAAPVKSHSSPSTGSSSPVSGPSKTSSSSANATGKLSSSSNSTAGESAASAYEVYPEGRILKVPNHRVFTFTELKSATKNFKPEMILGEGGFGRVYKGWIDEKASIPSRSGSGTVVAVKKLKPESMQGYEEWQCEVNFLGRLSHPNLVKLLGYCWEDKELLLVYEFMARGSLENHLFKKSVQSLSWSLRIKIAIQAAKGLAFLHASEKKIIYRDFKTANILLDSNYNPKLSDFGLAKNGPTGADSHVTTRIIGTPGYAAPEYIATGHLYVKSDVYGFGVVLLEMISGQRAIDENRPSSRLKLVNWSKPYLQDRRKLNLLMDPRLEGRYQSICAFQAAQLCLRCLAEEPKNRPSMKEVVETLEQIANSKVKISQNRQPLVHSRRGNVGSEARTRRYAPREQ